MTIEISYIIILSLLAIVVVLWLLYFVLRKKYRKLLLENTRQKELFNRMDNQKIEHFHRAQLNPHLLKNSLNGMLSHAYQTYYTMDKLAMVLDYVLYESEDELVSPKAEIEFARNLIEINKVKLSPLFDIRVRFDIDEVNSSMLNTPSLIPLVSVDLIENAFKHADFHGSDSFISIVLIFRNGWLDLMVSNRISKRSPLQKSKSGIGSKTLEERLMLYYPSRHQLRRFVENDVYNAHLQIKLYAE
ncbi:histidine kinase [Sphingobacterium zeae]|uniref:LytS/YehU family sensor histidine kinase n=1 Tax=Sphingobacterium zeae TaxID=1776859 RepID=A0ABU0U5T0_9SPHI|nr:histidine kinase [Sphingobacterium zeae]MDQ1150204.1 LytS/YehU family sensor histidine kinase [Sphingobacterium zeae]